MYVTPNRLLELSENVLLSPKRLVSTLFRPLVAGYVPQHALAASAV